MKRMKRISLDEYRKERVTDLMNDFFMHDNNFTKAVHNGEFFIDCHEHQIQAANIIHDLDEEGLLHIAKEIYPWEKETFEDYKKIYNEIQSGVRI